MYKTYSQYNTNGNIYPQAIDERNTYPQAGTITIAQDGTVTWGELTVNTYKCTANAKAKYTCVKP